jgi:hypothetical protein
VVQDDPSALNSSCACFTLEGKSCRRLRYGQLILAISWVEVKGGPGSSPSSASHRRRKQQRPNAPPPARARARVSPCPCWRRAGLASFSDPTSTSSCPLSYRPLPLTMASPVAPPAGSSPAPPPAAGGLAAAAPAAPASAAPSTAPSPRPPTILRPQPPPSINPHAHAHSQYQQPGQFYPPPVKNTKENPAMAFAAQADSYNRLLQGWLDWSTPYPLYRWTATGGLLFLFALRVVYGEGWYIVAYGLSIFLLNIFLAFLQPRFDPSLEADQAADDVEGGGDAGTGGGSGLGGLGLGKKLLRAVGVETAGQDGGILGESNEDEFKPFIRRLPGTVLPLSPHPLPDASRSVPPGASNSQRHPTSSCVLIVRPSGADQPCSDLSCVPQSSSSGSRRRARPSFRSSSRSRGRATSPSTGRSFSSTSSRTFLR